MSASKWPYATTRADRILRNALRNAQKQKDGEAKMRTAQWIIDIDTNITDNADNTKPESTSSIEGETINNIQAKSTELEVTEPVESINSETRPSDDTEPEDILGTETEPIDSTELEVTEPVESINSETKPSDDTEPEDVLCTEPIDSTEPVAAVNIKNRPSDHNEPEDTNSIEGETTGQGCLLVEVISDSSAQVYCLSGNVLADGTVAYTLPVPVSNAEPEGTMNIRPKPSDHTELVSTANAKASNEDSLRVIEIGSVEVEVVPSGLVDPLESDISSSEAQPKRSRKRKINKSSWKCNVRKLNRNKGIEYINRRGKRVDGKTFSPCSAHSCCKKGAECNNVSLDDRKEVFQHFWGLADYNLQQAYICGSISQRPARTHTVVRKSSDHSNVQPGDPAVNGEAAYIDQHTNTDFEERSESSSYTSRRRKRRHYKNFTRSFTLSTSKGLQVVCKELFLETLEISQGRVERALSAQRNNGGVVQKDRRGKHVKKATQEDTRKFVIEHISRFPRYVSHYTRSHQVDRKYLAPNMSLPIMYRLYKEACLAENRQPVKQSYYRHIFMTEFNLHFHQPLKDTCPKCDRFHVVLTSKPDDCDTAAQRDLHLRKAEKVRQNLNDSKSLASSEHLVITFDLEKTLICPMISCGVAYYKRQLSVYNLGVHNLADNSASMFMWDESRAGRGASEIGSCLLKYIASKVEHGLKRVTAFSDSCGGQNRNFKIATMLSFIVQEYSLESITLNFMQSGHSFLPNDADFGVIEKAKRSAGDVYVPEHWNKIVADARKRLPFTVIDMRPEDFVDVTAMSSQLVNRKTADDGSRVCWLNIQSIQFSSENPQIMKYKTVCDAEAPWFSVDFRKRTRHSSAFPDRIHLVQTTGEQRKLKRCKINDLLSLKQFIPPVYHSFYDGLQPDMTPNDADECDLELEDEMLYNSEDESNSTCPKGTVHQKRPFKLKETPISSKQKPAITSKQQPPATSTSRLCSRKRTIESSQSKSKKRKMVK